MLTRAAKHALHILMEGAVLGIAALALLGCGLAWRLAQGPIDITSLARREQAGLATEGVRVSFDRAALAWEGFVASNSPLDIRLSGIAVTSADGPASARIEQARVTLSLWRLLFGQIAPRMVTIDGAQLRVVRHREAAGAGEGGPAGAQKALASLSGAARNAGLGWLSQLRQVSVSRGAAEIRDDTLGLSWRAWDVHAELSRPAKGGMSGTAHAAVSSGAVQGSLDVSARQEAGGTLLGARVSALSPAALAAVFPRLAALAEIDVPVASHLEARLDDALQPVSLHLSLQASPGAYRHAGQVYGIAGAGAEISVSRGELRVESARLAFAAAAGKTSPPVISASARVSLDAWPAHAVIDVGIAAVELSDLADYWPVGTGGDARGWLVENIAGGHAHDGHVQAKLEIPRDFAGVTLTGLGGGMVADDVTVYWLKPVPPLTHGKARFAIESPDALRITMDSAEQNGVRVLPGTVMDITKLQEKHQFGDIDAKLAGPLDAAMGILNHPRLKLLSRSGLDFAGVAGDAAARLTVHIPLEARVTMDDIRIAATASLSGVHLGQVAAGRDLDNAALDLKVDNDGLQITGAGDFAGLPTSLVVGMDFTGGGPLQVVQHVTAHGAASAAQIAASGLPEAVAKVFTGGSAAIGVDFSARRNRTSTLLLDADLSAAALNTPLGWTKAAGPAADATARLSFDRGALSGIDHLHAKGPDLLIASHAELNGQRARTLVLDRLEVGETRAHGAIGLPAKTGDPIGVTLAGTMLDLSGYLAEPQSERARAVPSEDAAKAAQGRGLAWTADLRFDQVALAKGNSLAPFALRAASDGLHVTHAALLAGRPGELVARIAPDTGGRALSVTSEDAGVFLSAMGVADNLGGGHLQLDGHFADAVSGGPLTGTATLTNFSMRQAPAIGRLLQAMTLYGLTDVLRGPGLHFSQLIAPFQWRDRVLTLKSARAFSPSLGLTAQGDIDLASRRANVTGTVVPAYFFNHLLGDLPVVGRLFSPEKGGGVFAARYSVTGPLSNPTVGVNPLAALTPGFLREGFGLLTLKPPAGGAAAEK
jgi:uncharacterized protein YhdP